jgi:hypothetical protein
VIRWSTFSYALEQTTLDVRPCRGGFLVLFETLQSFANVFLDTFSCPLVRGRHLDPYDKSFRICRWGMTPQASQTRAGLRNARSKGTRFGRPRVQIDPGCVAALRRVGLSWSQVPEAQCMQGDRSASFLITQVFAIPEPASLLIAV